MTSTAKCRGCGAPIRWAETAAGRKMPLDERPEKRAVSEPASHGRQVVRIVDTWTPHWATCPVGARFKRDQQQSELFAGEGGGS